MGGPYRAVIGSRGWLEWIQFEVYLLGLNYQREMH